MAMALKAGEMIDAQAGVHLLVGSALWTPLHWKRMRNEGVGCYPARFQGALRDGRQRNETDRARGGWWFSWWILAFMPLMKLPVYGRRKNLFG